MIVGIGVDIISVKRIRSAVERHGDRFTRKLFTPAELAYCRARTRQYEHMAGRFAAKEAVAKAIGTGVAHGVSVREVEVVNNPDGKPDIVLHGRTERIVADRRIRNIHVSLSHTEEFAVAYAIAED